MIKIIVILLALTGASLGAKSPNPELKPFKTDSCTMFFDGNWGHCCLDHDLRYWIGGSKENQKLSDLKLKNCVGEAAGGFWANTIYHAVRLGHYSPIKNKYQWSWGWVERKKFAPLTELEKKMAVEEARRSTVDFEVVERFIQENGLEN